MPPITVSAGVARPAAEVFAYATDPMRFAEWQQRVVSGRMANGDHGAGAQCITVRRIGFADRASTSELVHIDPPRSWRIRGVDGPIRALVDVDVAPLTDCRSRLTIAIDFERRRIGRVLAPLVVRREARKEMPANIAALKRRLEA